MRFSKYISVNTFTLELIHFPQSGGLKCCCGLVSLTREAFTLQTHRCTVSLVSKWRLLDAGCWCKLFVCPSDSICECTACSFWPVRAVLLLAPLLLPAGEQELLIENWKILCRWYALVVLQASESSLWAGGCAQRWKGLEAHLLPRCVTLGFVCLPPDDWWPCLCHPGGCTAACCAV